VAQRPVYLPEEFLVQMRQAMPEHLSFDAFIAACERPLRRSIRVNTLKISVSDFLTLVAPYGWQLTPVPWCEEGFWIERDNEDALPLGSTAAGGTPRRSGPQWCRWHPADGARWYPVATRQRR
jgi:16S rRNA (cytosine1407-C5)-methyltransferase